MSEWPRRWRARWIWWELEHLSPEEEWAGKRRARPADGFGFLRRAFDLAAQPTRARCRVTCDGRYLLLVNGKPIGRGPIRSEPAHLSYDEFELPLVEGRNVIAALTRHYGGPVVHWKPAHPTGELGYGSFVCEVEIDGTIAIVTDRTWRARIAPYERSGPWPEGPPPPEVIDGRAIPERWWTPSFDDSSWAHAIDLDPRLLGSPDLSPPTEPFQLLAARPIAHLREDIVSPLGRWHGVHDFKRIVFGHPVVTIIAPRDTVVEVTCGEDVAEDGTIVTQPRDWKMRYIAAGTEEEETFESFEPVGFRYLSVSHVARVRARERMYPRAPGAYFRCSDESLNAIWETGACTLDLCSADAFIDCPGREQRAWLGDQSVVSLISLVANPDTSLVRHTLRLHAQGARPDGLLPMVAAGDFSERAETIPDSSLLWVRAVAAFVAHTGDRAFGDEMLPVVVRALNFFERFRDADGLLTDVPGWIFIDWAQTERGAHVAALDALYAMACEDAAKLAYGGIAEKFRLRAAATRAAFARYWDPARGVYVDSQRRVSQHTNALAILCGVPSERWAGMLDWVLDPARIVRTRTPGDPGTFGERMNRQWEQPADFDDAVNVVEAQPFFAHFLHQAMVRADRRDALLQSIHRWSALVARGNGCFEEYWDAAPGFGSRAHAWSATPVYDLCAHILGVRVTGDSVEVAPFLGDLEWCEGAVPTLNGLVHARFERSGEGTIELPEGATGTVKWNGKTQLLESGRITLA